MTVKRKPSAAASTAASRTRVSTTPASSVEAQLEEPASPGPVRRVQGSRRGDNPGTGSPMHERKTRPGPRPNAASPDILRAYAAGAATYDERTDAFMAFRRRVVDALDLRKGDVVVDVGCGTGLCMPLLHEKVGAQGAIIAVDESVAMLDIARARAEQSGWSNVTLIRASAAEVDLPTGANAALFCAVHDILRCPDSVRNILSQLPPGARIASGGGKSAAKWLLVLNSYVAALHRPFIRNFEGFDRPWSLLTPHLPDLHITQMAFGTGYVATARVPD